MRPHGVRNDEMPPIRDRRTGLLQGLPHKQAPGPLYPGSVSRQSLHIGDVGRVRDAVDQAAGRSVAESLGRIRRGMTGCGAGRPQWAENRQAGGEQALPWLRSQVSQIAAAPPVDDDGDMPGGCS